MADPPRSTSSPSGATGGDIGGTPRGLVTGTPRWVKLAWIAALIVVVLPAAMMLFGGGRHGPGMHTGGAAGVAPLGLVTVASASGSSLVSEPWL